MIKILHVRPDDDETITISQACNIYSLPRYRVYKDDTEFFLVKDTTVDLYMIVNVATNEIHRVLSCSSNRECIKFLLGQYYEIDVVIDEE